MKDVKGTLERIDAEIVQRRQNIAYHQVEIARLEDTRKVLMNLAEDDIERAEQARHPERVTAPMVHSITVRKVAEEELPPRTNGHAEGLNKRGDRRGMVHPMKGKHGGHGKGRFSANSAVGKMREKVVKVLSDAEEPMTGSEIGNYLGLAASDEVRKPLQNALYSMRVKGDLHRDAEHRYSMPKLRPAEH